jgi:hypothetical protein
VGDDDACAESDAKVGVVAEDVDTDANENADVREDDDAMEDAGFAVADTAAGDCGGEMRRASNSAIVILGLEETDHERTALSKA